MGIKFYSCLLNTYTLKYKNNFPGIYGIISTVKIWKNYAKLSIKYTYIYSHPKRIFEKDLKNRNTFLTVDKVLEHV